MNKEVKNVVETLKYCGFSSKNSDWGEDQSEFNVMNFTIDLDSSRPTYYPTQSSPSWIRNLSSIIWTFELGLSPIITLQVNKIKFDIRILINGEHAKTVSFAEFFKIFNEENRERIFKNLDI